MSKLPPLNEIDPELPTQTTELNFPKCKHELVLVNSHTAQCKKCSAGYSGPDIQLLVDASNK